jgi:MFS family permease
MIIACVLQTASQSVGMFIGARFLIGFGLTFAANAAPMLVTEISYPPYRASLTSLYNSLWYSGNIVLVPVFLHGLRLRLTSPQRFVDHLRHVPHRQQLVVACPVCPPGSPVGPPGPLRPLCARVSPLARQQGP